MSNGRVVPISVLVTARDVQKALSCSRTMAYEHLRRAAGRAKGERGMLRVPVHTWERYIARVFYCEERPSQSPAGNGPIERKRRALRPVNQDADSPLIPITRPRTKPRK